MSYCTQCGHVLSGNEKFCPECGTPVKKKANAALENVELKDVQPVFVKKTLRVKEYFKGKQAHFHDKGNVNLCGKFVYIPLLPKMYYLFMMADGTCTKEEVQKFNALCDSMDIQESERKAAIDYCEENISDDFVRHTVDIGNELKKLIEKMDHNCFTRSAIENNPDDLQPLFLAILWNLIDLGYADGDLKREEIDFIETLAKEWKIAADSLKELYETAGTVQALCRKIAWVRQSGLTDVEKQEAERKADDQIIYQYQSVRTLLTEAIRI